MFAISAIKFLGDLFFEFQHFANNYVDDFKLSVQKFGWEDVK